MAAAIPRRLLTAAMAAVVYWGAELPALAQDIVGFQGEYAPTHWLLFKENARDSNAFMQDAAGNPYEFSFSAALPGDIELFRPQPATEPVEQFPALSTDSLFLLGSNQADGTFNGYITLLVPVFEDITVSFAWDYQTEDIEPDFDTFRYVIYQFNETGLRPEKTVVLTDLTQDNPPGEPSAPRNQTGTIQAVPVSAGKFFGFQIWSFDNRFGAASVLINSFKVTRRSQPCGVDGDNCPPPPPPPPASVPEPGVAISTLLVSISLFKLRRK
jgi:hypothetical protein